ncbi:AAA family ATPase [Lactiplantibacillus modestisalitolerans]|uniref:AAA family ATPase n=1 Tax=Lactiplantibacillus modestisalitolerans TaxID=1457219 RepID=A0ABV5WUF3_9LACO|nr:AAA family ATPase [Lactiplantibacillus modestisalitolerans]
MNSAESIKENIRKISGNIQDVLGKEKIISFSTMTSLATQRTVIANLAIMYGQAGVKVIILDTDFSNDLFSSTFQVKSESSLDEFLNGKEMNINKIITNIPGQEVDLIPSIAKQNIGHGQINATEDPRLKMLLSYLSKKYDLVLINTPQIIDDKKMNKVLSLSDGVIFLHKVKVSRKKTVRMLLKNANLNKVNILGYIAVED